MMTPMVHLCLLALLLGSVSTLHIHKKMSKTHTKKKKKPSWRGTTLHFLRSHTWCKMWLMAESLKRNVSFVPSRLCLRRAVKEKARLFPCNAGSINNWSCLVQWRLRAKVKSVFLPFGLLFYGSDKIVQSRCGEQFSSLNFWTKCFIQCLLKSRHNENIMNSFFKNFHPDYIFIVLWNILVLFHATQSMLGAKKKKKVKPSWTTRLYLRLIRGTFNVGKGVDSHLPWVWKLLIVRDCPLVQLHNFSSLFSRG